MKKVSLALGKADNCNRFFFLFLLLIEFDYLVFTHGRKPINQLTHTNDAVDFLSLLGLHDFDHVKCREKPGTEAWHILEFVE